jgi:hypothetical protein
MMQAEMRTMDMERKQQKIGTSTLSSNLPAASPPARHNTVRTRTFLTRTQRRGATSCTRRKEKERHPKVVTPFFSRKVSKARARAKEKARANQAKARAIARAKT